MTEQERLASNLMRIGIPKATAECLAAGHKCSHDYFDALKEQRDHFEAMSKEPGRGNEQYYSGMASGLTVALQVIDRPRYEREAKALQPQPEVAK